MLFRSLYIIFIIVKFLKFYENEFLNYINYLCEPNKYISLIILLKIYEKVKFIEELFEDDNSNFSIYISEFYEIDKKKNILFKEIEILNKKVVKRNQRSQIIGMRGITSLLTMTFLFKVGA